jgi:hypothetical protein
MQEIATSGGQTLFVMVGTLLHVKVFNVMLGILATAISFLTMQETVALGLQTVLDGQQVVTLFQPLVLEDLIFVMLGLHLSVTV